jgi:hypothetical protein
VKLEDQQFLSSKFFNLPCEFCISRFFENTAIEQTDQHFLSKNLSEICSFGMFKRLAYIARCTVTCTGFNMVSYIIAK